MPIIKPDAYTKDTCYDEWINFGSMSCTASFIISVTSKTKKKCHCQQRKKTHFQKCA